MWPKQLLDGTHHFLLRVLIPPNSLILSVVTHVGGAVFFKDLFA